MVDKDRVLLHRMRLISKLKKIRESKGLSQRALADCIGVRRSTISDMESLKTCPSMSLLVKYALELECTLEIEPTSYS